jgi:hypothetical protein
VSVRDDRGDLFQLPCRVYQDGPPIAKESRVKLVAYNGRQQMYYVLPAAAETVVPTPTRG